MQISFSSNSQKLFDITFLLQLVGLSLILSFNSSTADELINKKALVNNHSSPMGTLPLQVAYNKTTDIHHARNEQYFIDVIELALQKSGIPYQTKTIELENQTETRGAELLEQGVFDIHWFNTSIELEERLLPIRIPLFKGLVGWRIFAINKSKVDAFKEITSPEQLKSYSPLQGNDWPDTKILKSNGFRVETAREFRSLQRMLQHGHGDFFPRSVIEIWHEYESASQTEIVIEESLAIQYPAAYYLFVAKDNIRLRDAIKKGLDTAISDGSFNTLFSKYFRNSIRQAKLGTRKIFTIPNPYLPAKTPLDQKELWFRMDDPSLYSNKN